MNVFIAWEGDRRVDFQAKDWVDAEAWAERKGLNLEGRLICTLERPTALEDLIASQAHGIRR